MANESRSESDLERAVLDTHGDATGEPLEGSTFLSLMLTGFFVVAVGTALYFLLGALLGSDLLNNAPTVEIGIAPEKVAVQGLEGAVDNHAATEAIMLVDGPTSGSSYRMWALLEMLKVAAVAVGLWMMRGIAESLRIGDPFTEANVGRLQTIGMLLIVVPLVTQFVDGIVRDQLTLDTPFAGLVDPYWLVSFAPAMFGLLIMTLADVWKRGIKIRDELRFTV